MNVCELNDGNSYVMYMVIWAFLQVLGVQSFKTCRFKGVGLTSGVQYVELRRVSRVLGSVRGVRVGCLNCAL